jgi:hypothetical protein
MAKETTQKATDKVTGAVPKVKWDDSGMKSSYANVCNVTSTREEMTLYFGTNQSIYTGKEEEVTVQLSDRIVLNPYAAKRLLLLLNRVVGEYEKRFGTLDLSVGSTTVPPTPPANPSAN